MIILTAVVHVQNSNYRRRHHDAAFDFQLHSLLHYFLKPSASRIPGLSTAFHRFLVDFLRISQARSEALTQTYYLRNTCREIKYRASQDSQLSSLSSVLPLNRSDSHSITMTCTPIRVRSGFYIMPSKTELAMRAAIWVPQHTDLSVQTPESRQHSPLCTPMMGDTWIVYHSRLDSRVLPLAAPLKVRLVRPNPRNGLAHPT